VTAGQLLASRLAGTDDVGDGQGLLIEGGHPVDVLPALMGAFAAGRTPVVVPPRTDPAAAAALLAALPGAAHRAGVLPGGLLALPTSGTTSTPRSVLRSVTSWDAALDAFTAVTGTREGDVVWAPGSGSSTLTVWALWHALARCVDALATGPWRGVPARMAGVLDPVTVLHCVPAVLADVLTAREHGALPALRTAVVAGAPLPADLRRRAGAAGLTVVEYYGAAELSFVAADPGGDGLRPFPGCEVRVREGLVEVRSPYLSLGYLVPPGASPGPWYRRDDGWAGVGDRGRLAADGVLEVAGRGGRAVSVGGQVVLSADVERVLGGVEGVLEVVCVGAPDGRLGQRTCAVVRTSGGDGGDLRGRLRAAARRHLPPAARPVRYLLVDDLPRTAAGKTDLPAVTELLAAPGAAPGRVIPSAR
jgi:long-chain acyl-CoA synthetase